MKLIFATGNPGKLKEIKNILSDLDVEVLGMREVGIKDEIVEDGQTLEENSLKKAHFVIDKTNQWALADDTGIFIKALNDEPGIYAARWAGANASDDDMVCFTLDKLKTVPVSKRQVVFKTVAVLVAPDGQEWIFEGVLEGAMATKPRGELRPKLPYDLLFVPEGHNKTFSEMSDEKKNSLSHRGQAFSKLKKHLNDKLSS